MKTMLRIALAALSIANIGPAFAGEGGDVVAAQSGYVYPNFWGTESTQHASAASRAPAQSNGATIGTYATQSSNGTWLTWLLPPTPYGS